MTEEFAAWYPGLDGWQIERRFRANLILSGVPSFREDQLFTEDETVVTFQIGDVTLRGVNPCGRCVVVTRDPVTGAATPDFQPVFSTKRRETLPSWADELRINHYFRLATNTVGAVSQIGKILRVGDEVRWSWTDRPLQARQQTGYFTVMAIFSILQTASPDRDFISRSCVAAGNSWTTRLGGSRDWPRSFADRAGRWRCRRRRSRPALAAAWRWPPPCRRPTR